MQELDNKIISLFQEMAAGQGLNDQLMINIWAKVYIEPEPVAIEDIAKETGYSLASVSNKVKVLAPLMHIQKIRKPGSKKIYLKMEKNILSIFREALTKKEQFMINTIKQKLPDIIKEYKIKAKTEVEKRKIKVMEDYYEQILKFETIIKKMIEEFNRL